MSTPKMPTPPRGMQPVSPNPENGARPTGARQLRLFGVSAPELSTRASKMRPSEPPLVEGLSAKKVPDAFFHPSKTVSIDQIARRTSRYGRCSRAQLEQLYNAYDLLFGCYENCPDPETGKPRMRDDGSDYLQHALRVAYRIAVIGRGRVEDLQQTIAALLHDIVEDFGVHVNEIRRRFGNNVADMVFWLTKPKWNGVGWVYPDSPQYYNTEDKYDHSMYNRRGSSYYHRLFYHSNNPSAWVIKAADNLDNLHTLRNVEETKRRRNTRIIVDNTLAVLSRMLAMEDTERLVRYIRQELGFEVPKDAIARFADSPIVLYEPRDALLRHGLEGVYAPRHGQINVYGADPKYLFLLGWLELGLPDDGNDYLRQLVRILGKNYIVRPEASYLPPGLAASEAMFRISGFREDRQLLPYTSHYDHERRIVHLTKDGVPYATVITSAIENLVPEGYRLRLSHAGGELVFDAPHMRALLGAVEERLRDFLLRLEEFRTECMLASGAG